MGATAGEPGEPICINFELSAKAEQTFGRWIVHGDGAVRGQCVPIPVLVLVLVPIPIPIPIPVPVPVVAPIVVPIVPALTPPLNFDPPPIDGLRNGGARAPPLAERSALQFV
jgi:hypothetical protein